MYNLPQFCCICFNNKDELKSINNKDCMETQILHKLNFCSFETEWIVPDFPIYICRKCCHILDLACDFKNMCIKSNRLLRGYVTQLKSASNTVDNIRNELFMMFNNDKHIQQQDSIKINHQMNHLPVQLKPDAGPSTKMQSPIYSRPQQQQSTNILPLKDDNREDLRQQSMVQKSKEATDELVNNYNNIRTINKPQMMTPNKQIHSNDKSEKIVVQVDNSVMNCFDIKSEFVNELATCSNPVEAIMHPNETFNFELKPPGQHQCSLCHKCFSRESVLTRHMLIHSGERPHHCNVCNKNFTHKFNLKQHMLIHSGHKTHHCTVCNKGFIKKSDLDRHMLTHFGERIHHCTICGKSFVRKENLNQHILTHTGQKPHHCTQCTKSFLRKSDLNRHALLCISKRS